MKNDFFLFCIFAVVIFINTSRTATISANEKIDDSLAENTKDGFLPPEGETIQFLDNDMIGKSCLLSDFRHKWNGGGRFKTRICIANKVSEIPCGQHHRFTLSVSGGGKQKVFWYSANPEIVHINVKTGKLTARGGREG